MPKLIVYVKSSTWQRVVDQAGEDAPALARALSVEAIEEFVAGLSERDHTDGKVMGAAPAGQSPASSAHGASAGSPVDDARRARSESRHVTADQEWLMRRAGKRK